MSTKSSERPAPFAGLKSLAARGGAALGDAYARVARTVLDEVERLEDANAERRYRLQRLKPTSINARKPRPLPAK